MRAAFGANSLRSEGRDTLDGGEDDDLFYGRDDGEAGVMTGGAGRDIFLPYERFENGAWVPDDEEDETDFNPQEDRKVGVRFSRDEPLVSWNSDPGLRCATLSA